MAAEAIRKSDILKAIPQQAPFRFIDEISELDDEHIVGSYRFHKDEFFYPGHFPGNPITPGVILIETMGQIGIVAFGIYLACREWKLPLAEVEKLTTLFTVAESVEFMRSVKPGERVIVRASKLYFRKGSLKVNAVMERENGEDICRGVLAGMGVPLNGRR